MNENVAPLAASRARPDESGQNADRVLLQLVRLVHAMNERERALALVLLRSVTAMDGSNKPN